MSIRTVTKALAGKEDLLLGNETHEQTRNGQVVTVTGLSAEVLPTGAVDSEKVSTALLARAKIVDKMADLASVALTHEAVQLLGFHTKGDGGGGVFYWDASKDKSEHNGGTVIDPNKAGLVANWEYTQILYFTPEVIGQGCWVREYSGAVDVKWFGAKGDGVSDDTNSIQKSLQSKSIFIPNGVYIVTDTLGSATDSTKTLDNCTIVGESKLGSIIKMETNQDLDVFVLGWWNTLKNIKVRQNTTVTGGSKGVIRLQSMVHPEIPTVSGNDWTDPEVGGLSYQNTFVDCIFENGQNYTVYGLNLAYTTFEKCRIVLARGASGNLFVDGTDLANGRSNNPASTTVTIIDSEFIASTGGLGVHFRRTESSTLTSSIMEGNFSRGLLIEDCTNISVNKCYLENNYALALGAGSGDADIVTVDSDAINVIDTRILGNWTTNAIASSNTTNSVLQGGYVSGEGGTEKNLSIDGWVWSKYSSAIHQTGNTATASGGDTFVKLADGTFISTLRRSLTVDITAANGNIFVDPSGQVITDYPTGLDAIVYSDLSKEMTATYHVMSSSADFVWVVGSGSSKLNNALRFRLVSPTSKSGVSVDLQVQIIGRWR
jgi:hypothetical protein